MQFSITFFPSHQKMMSQLKAAGAADGSRADSFNCNFGIQLDNCQLLRRNVAEENYKYSSAVDPNHRTRTTNACRITLKPGFPRVAVP
jgi:hypothetical protein